MSDEQMATPTDGNGQEMAVTHGGYEDSIPNGMEFVNEAIAERAAVMAADGVQYPDEKAQICHFAAHGFRFIPKLKNGKTLGSWPRDCGGIDRALAWYDQGYHLLYGLNLTFVGFDLDRKNGKDGVKVFESICPIWRIDDGEFPAFTVTASGGYHLFFRSEGVVYVGSCGNRKLGEGVDIRCQTVPVAVPGSIKNDRPYQFYGDLAQAPLLPLTLRQRLKVHAMSPACTKPPAPPQRLTIPRQRSASGIDSLANWLDSKGPTGMNARLFQLGSWAKNEGFAYSEVCQFVQARYGLDPIHPDIAHAIREAK
jgi:hypothetical protein